MTEREQLIADLNSLSHSMKTTHLGVSAGYIDRAIAALSERGEARAANARVRLDTIEECAEVCEERGKEFRLRAREILLTDDQHSTFTDCSTVVLDCAVRIRSLSAAVPPVQELSDEPLQGWVMVPIEPPRYLVDAMVESDMTAEGPLVSVRQAANLYRAVIEAAQDK